MKILSVVGARPQFVKLFPIHRAAMKYGVTHRIVHTGQHYDPNMSEHIFADLGIPEPDVNLEVGSGSHAQQTGKILMGLEPFIQSEKPDWVLVYGDTNSTVAAALAAVKIHVPVAHLEAGLRSGNKMMPEEHNRVATDHLSDILLAPTQQAMQQLECEGLGKKSFLVGDVMVDACVLTRERVLAHPPKMSPAFEAEADFALATIHRAENTSSKERIKQILVWLGQQDIEVRLLAHPRLVGKCEEFGLVLSDFGVRPFEPLNYSEMVFALTAAKGVITDSGGLQKEAFLMRVPCVTVRTETEWPETLVGGWNVLDNNLSMNVVERFATARTEINSDVFGDAHAAERVIEVLIEESSR